MEITISKNEIVEHVNKNSYLEEEGEKINLCCIYQDNSKGSKDCSFIKYSLPVDFSNKNLTGREREIREKREEMVDKIIEGLKQN